MLLGCFKMYASDSLKTYLDDLAARKPAPGGGSVAALVAALGAGLLSMVANFTLDNLKYSNVESRMKEILNASEGLRQKCLELVDGDVAVYTEVSAAFKLPRDSAEEKEKRGNAVQQALKQALAVPLDVCKYCCEAVRLCQPLIDEGNPNLVSDVGVAVVLLESAYNSALLNVGINLKGIKDKEFADMVEATLQPLGKELREVREKIWDQTLEKLNPQSAP